MTDIRSGEPTKPTTLRLREPEDLLSAIPFLLKFHPDNSLVFLLLAGKRSVVTARIDLDRDRDEPDPDVLAAYLQSVCAAHGADGVILVAYHDAVGWASEFLLRLTLGLDALVVHQALIASGSRWWSCFCDCPTENCGCDTEGTPYDLSTTAISAQAVLAGLPALPSRDALARSVAGPGSVAERRAGTAAIEEVLGPLSDLTLDERRDRLALLVEGYCLRRAPLTDHECAELAVLSYDPPVRDVAVVRMSQEDADAHVELWHQVVARTVAPFESAPLCLLGLAGWLAGNGALQVVCMERAETINPDFSLLHILDEINRRCVAPSAWRELVPAEL